MKQGKLIVIEGTDGSGKKTQSELLTQRLNDEGIESIKLEFPRYDTPTGRIVGGCYLGKDWLGECYFPEGADKVDYRVASCYFAADRRYNFSVISDELKRGVNVVLDRYVESNMAHQGGKITNVKKRFEAYQFIHDLEYNLMKLKRPDGTIFLYVPYAYSQILREKRGGILDEHEKNPEHLIHAENAYIELEKLYNFNRINCIQNNELRTREDINDEVLEKTKKLILK